MKTDKRELGMVCEHLKERLNYEYMEGRRLRDIGQTTTNELAHTYRCNITGNPCVARREVPAIGIRKWYRVFVNIDTQQRCPAYNPRN